MGPATTRKIIRTAGIQSTITRSPKGTSFLNVFGDTFPIKDKLSGLGFRYFKGVWGMPAEMAKQKRDQIATMGIDVSILDTEQAQPGAAAPVAQGPSQAQGAPIDKTLLQMKKELDEEIKGAQLNEKTKKMITFIDQMIDKVALSVDEAAKQDFVKSFLAFSSRFYNYSFGNQMLIWVQKPDSSYVAGHRQWLEKGRQVVNWGEGISILRPQQNKRPLNEREKATTPPEEHGKVVSWTSFAPTTVYDISATTALPNWKDKEGRGPFEVPALKSLPDQEEDQVTLLVSAANRFAQSLGISVDLEKELRDSTGGYSAGQEIAINKKYKGINQFSTLVHEMAHEFLHREDDQKTPVRDESRQSKEIDAETTAYIVLNHYGYESKDAPNYLALWRGTGEGIKKRRDNIVKAVRLVITGIDKEMGNVIQNEGDTPVPANQATAWVRANCKFASR